ncbi:3-methyladenine DNA glycosylase AlkC [Litoreibacter ponti]|uniref:3-methyladenine DNA glycosylase AlkC n=1 Tax=Litoreibacter ponti TaxID=1510457 RepID=A0A2T6BLF7_9RHOB|nr:DNA alkylation repair protein [Litoreibacter ponti]PTX56910.1 3-methyladenine DNA glycosylase AlkC [Litoreibacter ponti]
MPEPFKTLYNPEMVRQMADHLARVSPEFERDVFEGTGLYGLDALEMMARSEQISLAIDAAFPDDPALKRTAMIAALHPETERPIDQLAMDETGIAGWAVEPMARVIVRNGIGTPRESLAALAEMTKRFTAEFAVRPFFRDHPDLTLEHAHAWATADNVHLRRLASEGSRPLLPWGIKLHQFVENPAPLIPLLTKLRDDPEEYVRRSVANNLNDIAKNQPDLVAELAQDWIQGATRPRSRLVKHACRTLIKQGHPGALAAFGYTTPQLSDVALQAPDQVKLGEAMEIEFSFTAETEQSLLIDYVLHFLRKNGQLSPKVFKWTELTVKAGEQTQITKRHPYRKVTTRADYPGAQKLSVQVNGVTVAETGFELSL